jgi:hypothetical protein
MTNDQFIDNLGKLLRGSNNQFREFSGLPPEMMSQYNRLRGNVRTSVNQRSSTALRDADRLGQFCTQQRSLNEEMGALGDTFMHIVQTREAAEALEQAQSAPEASRPQGIRRVTPADIVRQAAEDHQNMLAESLRYQQNLEATFAAQGLGQPEQPTATAPAVYPAHRHLQAGAPLHRRPTGAVPTAGPSPYPYAQPLTGNALSTSARPSHQTASAGYSSAQPPQHTTAPPTPSSSLQQRKKRHAHPRASNPMAPPAPQRNPQHGIGSAGPAQPQPTSHQRQGRARRSTSLQEAPADSLLRKRPRME